MEPAQGFVQLVNPAQYKLVEAASCNLCPYLLHRYFCAVLEHLYKAGELAPALSFNQDDCLFHMLLNYRLVYKLCKPHRNTISDGKNEKYRCIYENPLSPFS